MKKEKFKVLLYPKKNRLDKLGKAPITGWPIVQFSCWLYCPILSYAEDEL
ncbi:hypothetical protein [Porphyromonas macacae]